MDAKKALEKVAKEAKVSVKDVRELICGLAINEVSKHEAIVLYKIALRNAEKWQKDAKKERRKGDNLHRSDAQMNVDANAFKITSLLRKYLELRGKDPEIHSLKKWGY